MSKIQRLNKSLLGKIIKEVESDFVDYDQSRQTLVVVDSRGQTYDVKPTGPSFFKTYRYFLVDTHESFNYEGYLCTLTNADGITNIIVEYKVRCQPHNASTLAIKIYSANDPNEILNGILQRTVEEADKSHSLINDFYAVKGSVEKRIIDKLSEYAITVLSIKLKIEDDQKWLRSQAIDVALFKITLEGNFPKVCIGINAVIIPIQGQESKFLAKKVTDENIENEVLRIIRAFYSKNITPEELSVKYNTDFRETLEARINDYLSPFGRELLELSFKLQKGGNLNAIIFQSQEFFNVRLNDTLYGFKLRYKCELVANKLMKARAGLFPLDTNELEELIVDQIKSTLASDINVEEFCDELNTTVSNKIATGINSITAVFGREVGFLHIESQGIPSKDIEIKHNVTCMSLDAHEVVVNNILLLQRDYNLKKIFDAVQISDFDLWGKNELNRITKNFIITKKYNELLFDFDDKVLRNEMQKEAQKIGYTVNQLITLPQFGTDPKPERFKISYKNTNLNSKVDGIALALSIHVEGRISDYKKMIKLLAPKESVLESMENTIDSKIRQFFNSLDPDRFYVRFYSQDITKGDKDILESEIKVIIIKCLTDEYGAEIRDVAVNPLNTPLIIRFKQLQEGTFESEFQDKTCYFRYRVPVAISNVDPERWSVFNSRAYKMRSEDSNDSERKDIASHIRNYVENGLNTELVPMIKKGELSNNKDFTDQLKRLLSEVTIEIREFFGLVVQIYNPVKIEPEGYTNKQLLEDKMRKLDASIKLQQSIDILSLNEKKERLESLYRQRREKEENNFLANSPEMKRINDEIEKLENGAIDWDKDGPHILEGPF